MRSLSVARRIVLAIWLSLIALVVAAVVVAHGAPMLGYRLVIIRGPSMSPEIEVGALVFEERVPAGDIRPGDIVTLTAPTGAVITHRVVRVAQADGILQFETRGDANPSADPALHPARAISGVVKFSLPIAGFLLAFFTLPTGILSVVSLLGSLLASLWLLEDLEQDRREEPEPAAGPVPDGLAA